MRKNLFILAAAALALASCSSDETTAVNDSVAKANEINFRAFNNGLTRAADVDANAGTYGLKTLGFTVFANVYGSSSEGANYIPETKFTWNSASSSYTSADKYYWPSSDNLNFYAYASSIPAQVSHTALSYVFTVTPAPLSSATTAAGQTDLVFANVNNQGKIASGVPLNFRHTESKVSIQVKNTNPNLIFTVDDVAIQNIYGAGTYTYPSNNVSGTSTAGAGNLSQSNWATSGDRTVGYSLKMTSTSSHNVLSGTTAAKNIVSTDNDMILIPQAFVGADAYASSGGSFAGACLTAKIKIQNMTNSAYIAGGSSTWVTAMWPLPVMTMQPGYKYTFIIDLAGGGYYYTDTDSDGKLDPILEGAEIKFVSVTVDSWDNAANTIVANAVAGGTYTNNEAAAAAGTYSVTVSGLTSGSTLALGATTSNNLSGLKIYNTSGTEVSTTPSNGVVTITGTLAANSTASKVTSTITLNETGTATSTTTINVVQPASGS